ncbi:MAG: hypothetical protein AAGF99_00345 [Bacteroidota bacterium]
MTLSDAIRAGIEHTDGQAFGSYGLLGLRCCVLGTASLGMDRTLKPHVDVLREHVEAVDQSPPLSMLDELGDRYGFATLWALLMCLNDVERWSREDIADLLARHGL